MNWDITRKYIHNAAMITVFGYSALKTDKEAIDLLHSAWGKKESRDLEEVSIIDILNENTLLDTWDDFIFSHHFNVTKNIFESYLGKFPRRSTEAVFDMFFGCNFQNGDRGLKARMSFDDLQNYLQPFLEDEKKNDANELTNPFNIDFKGW